MSYLLLSFFALLSRLLGSISITDDKRDRVKRTFEGVAGVDVAGVVRDAGVVGVSALDDTTPLGGFRVVGMGVFGNAAKDDDMA